MDDGTSDGRATLAAVLGLVQAGDFAGLPTARLIGRASAGAGAGEVITASQALDMIGATRGAVLVRGASGWAILAPGTAGHVLTTQGSGADPIWQAVSGGGGSADDWEIVTATAGATYQLTNPTGNTIVKLDMTGNTVISPPSGGTFGAGKRFFVIYELAASGAARSPSFASHTLVGGVSPLRTVQTTDQPLRIVTFTDNNASSWNIQGDWNFAEQPTATPETGDVLVFADASDSNSIRKAALLASTTNPGIAEAAIDTEVNAGLASASTVLYVSPQALRASEYGVRTVALPLADRPSSDQATGNDVSGVAVPQELNGWDIIGVRVVQSTAGTTGASTYMLRRFRSGSGVDVLSSNLSVSSGALSGDGTINTANDDLQTNDELRVNIVGLSTTVPKGGYLIVRCRRP
ncbi:MAG: hypothetical protein N2688_00205 [Burkholderiaceae bacterium]|nr:hypothetical protein [Burkholderiaceae bacterium]